MKRLLWISWHQTPYNDYLFNEIAKEYNLDVVYIRKILTTHPWKEEVANDYNSSSWEKRTNRITVLKQILSNRYTMRIVAGWNHPLMILALMYYSISKKAYAVWTDTPHANPNRSRSKKIFHRVILKRIVTGASVILVTGKVGVEKIHGIYGDVRAVNFPFATDLNFYHPATQKFDPARTVIVCSVGRLLNAHKGTDVAIEAFGLLRERNNGLKFEYRIIGDGPDRESLANQIKACGLENEIKIIGWLEPHEILRNYQESSFFIHPSHTDPFPNAVLEAMACGLPVIGSDAAGSVVERVSQDVNGYIFTDGNAQQLSQYMEALMLHPETIEKFGKEARKTAEQWPCQYNLFELGRVLNHAD